MSGTGRMVYPVAAGDEVLEADTENIVVSGTELRAPAVIRINFEYV